MGPLPSSSLRRHCFLLFSSTWTNRQTDDVISLNAGKEKLQNMMTTISIEYAGCWTLMWNLHHA